MTRSLLLLFGCVIAGSTFANPLLENTPYYLSSEQLDVVLSLDAAQIDGRFHFRTWKTPGGSLPKHPILLTVPIWIPSDPACADQATAALLKKYAVNKGHHLEEGINPEWDAAIGLKITVGDQPIKIRFFGLHGPPVANAIDWVPKAWRREGFHCVMVTADFKPLLLAGDPEIRIQYRQGLRSDRAGREFFYVPVFENLPQGMKTDDLKTYAMNLENRSGDSILIGRAKLEPNSRSRVALAHHSAILALMPPR